MWVVYVFEAWDWRSGWRRVRVVQPRDRRMCWRGR